MLIHLKNKHTLLVDDFKLRCCIGKNGIAGKKLEGDKKTPKGTYEIENLYYRKDRISKPKTKLKCVEIKRDIGWCDDISKEKYYNKLIEIKKNIKCEKLFRKDYKYDLFIPIKYNFKNPKVGFGSCIFIHLTKNYKPTAGWVALKKKIS